MNFPRFKECFSHNFKQRKIYFYFKGQVLFLNMENKKIKVGGFEYLVSENDKIIGLLVENKDYYKLILKPSDKKE